MSHARSPFDLEGDAEQKRWRVIGLGSDAFASDLTVAGQRRTFTGLPPKLKLASAMCSRIRAQAHHHFMRDGEDSTAGVDRQETIAPMDWSYTQV
jgi:hypothetical protein